MNSNEIFQVIEEVAATNSHPEKDAILAKHMGDPMMLMTVVMACNPFITFGVKPPKATMNGEGMFTDEGEPWLMLGKLQRRELTGNEAKDAIASMLSSLEPDSSELLWRILNKDLKASFTKGTVNRLVPGTIPTFDVMLSKVYEEKRIKLWPVGVEPKMDGLRAMGLVKSGAAKFYSRVGNHFPALDHLSDSTWAMIVAAHAKAKDKIETGKPSTKQVYEFFYAMLGGNKGPSLAIDCEAITGGDFYASSGDVKRKSVQAENITMHSFDALPYDKLTGKEVEIAIPFKVRRAFTEFVVSHAKDAEAPFCVTPIQYAQSHEEIMEITVAHWDAGREGSMVKLLESPYIKKKGYHWLKIKKEETEDLRVVDAFEGEPHTKYVGMLGGLIVDRNGVQVRVGGGFSDEQRASLWGEWILDQLMMEKRPDLTGPHYIFGRLIEVEYHEVTPDGSLRHPRFVKFRDDKDEKKRAA